MPEYYFPYTQIRAVAHMYPVGHRKSRTDSYESVRQAAAFAFMASDGARNAKKAWSERRDGR